MMGPIDFLEHDEVNELKRILRSEDGQSEHLGRKIMNDFLAEPLDTAEAVAYMTWPEDAPWPNWFSNENEPEDITREDGEYIFDIQGYLIEVNEGLKRAIADYFKTLKPR